MRRAFSFLSLVFVIPLAACFDAELSIAFPDDTNAEATMTMVASPDFYAMATSSGEPFCKGEETLDDAGNHVCTEVISGTIDEVANDPDVGEGLEIERRDGGLLYVAFDLGDLTEDIAPPEEEEGADEMIAMMKAAFEGHSIAIKVSGAQIVETNGTLSDDGKMASFEIPLGAMLDNSMELPETFNALLRPGS